MHRRSVLGGVAAGLGAALAGCSTAASDAGGDPVDTELVLVNHMGAPTTFELVANGPTDRALTYEVEPNTARVIEDYIDEGSYSLTVENEIEVEAEDGGTETVTRTATGSWTPSNCHTCKLRARRSGVEIDKAECTTATAAPTTDGTTAGNESATATGTGTGTDR